MVWSSNGFGFRVIGGGNLNPPDSGTPVVAVPLGSSDYLLTYTGGKVQWIALDTMGQTISQITGAGALQSTDKLLLNQNQTADVATTLGSILAWLQSQGIASSPLSLSAPAATPHGSNVVLGGTFSGSGYTGPANVDVSTDGGTTWSISSLATTLSASNWSATIPSGSAPAAGTYIIQVRDTVLPSAKSGTQTLVVT